MKRWEKEKVKGDMHPKKNENCHSVFRLVKNLKASWRKKIGTGCMVTTPPKVPLPARRF